MATKKRSTRNVEKTQNGARLPAKMQRAFFAASQNTAPATQNGRAQIHWWPQVKMHIFELENVKKKNAFRLHEKQISDGANDNFSDGETQGLRVCVCVYIYMYVCMYVCVYIYIFTYTYTHAILYVCLSVCMYVRVYVWSGPVRSVCLSACLSACRLPACLHVCIYMLCIYLFVLAWHVYEIMRALMLPDSWSDWLRSTV